MAAYGSIGDEPADKPTTDNEEKKEGSKTSYVIAECRKRLELCIDFEGENRTNGLDDLMFLSGNQWPANIQQARQLDQRPCLTINTLPTYLHQVTNDQRQNKGAIKIHPVDEDANEETGEVIQGLIRHIEYDSNAETAYDRAVSSAAAMGWGYFRLVTEFCSPSSTDQDIKFKSVRNAMTVYFDPGSEEPDGSDAKFAIISVKIRRDEFKRLYPDADEAGWDQAAGSGDYADWIDDIFIRIAEYYYIDYEDATACRLSDGRSMYQEDFDKLKAAGKIEMGVTVIKTRATQRPRVKWCKLTAFEELERTELPGEYIPVFPVYGDELDIEGKVVRSGLIRYAKDPVRMNNYWMTKATEEVSLRGLAPYMMAEGQEEGHEDDFAQANTRSFPYLTYKPTALEGMLLPPPQRQQMADVPTGTLAMAMHAADNIQKCIGIFNAGIGAKSNETSGKAILARQREGDIGTYHYTDNLNKTRKHAGRVILSWLPFYYDSERTIRILGEDGTASHVTVNQPNQQQKPDKQGQVQQVLNDLTKGKYDATVTSGPSYTTLRQEAAESMSNMVQAAPQLLDIAGDQMIRNMDWPGAQETADRMKRYISLKTPGVIKDDDEAGPMVQTPKGPVSVDEAGQIITQLEQTVNSASQAMEQSKVQETQNDAKELAIKEKDAETKRYEAETKRIQADAAMLEANAKAAAAGESIQAAAVAAAREAVHLMLNTPLEQLPAGALDIPHPAEDAQAAPSGAGMQPPQAPPVAVEGAPA